MLWNPSGCRVLAAELMTGLPSRWLHVEAVADLTQTWADSAKVGELVVCAAWLHDVGYASGVGVSGMHSVDGATFLARLSAPSKIVSLVAFHTGAEYEASERGLVDKLIPFDLPDQEDLEALTLADLVTGPTGKRVTVQERLSDILRRYEPQHPVHRAVQRSRPCLIESAKRAAERLGYPM